MYNNANLTTQFERKKMLEILSNKFLSVTSLENGRLEYIFKTASHIF